jgi:hypothetical protein
MHLIERLRLLTQRFPLHTPALLMVQLWQQMRP